MTLAHRPIGNGVNTQRKLFGLPLTDRSIILFGALAVIATLEVGLGFYGEYRRTQRIKAPASTTVGPQHTTDMPIPNYRWVTPLVDTVQKRAANQAANGY